MTKLDVIFNEKHKKRTWYNWNYFYIGTVFLILTISLSFFFLDEDFSNLALQYPKLNGVLLQHFRHADIYHLLGNMVSFLLIGLIIERQFGTVGLIFMFFTLGACSNFVYGGVGASGTNYCFYGFIYIIVIFNFKHFMLSGKQTILNWVCLTFITIIMFWNDTNPQNIGDFFSFFKFSQHVDLWDNFAHLNGFVVGTIIGFFYCTFPKIRQNKEAAND